MIYRTDFLKRKGEKNKLKDNARKLILQIQKEENIKFGNITLIYCGDEEIRKFNKTYLGHDYETDIITFHDTDEKGNREGELLISAETVQKNSKRYSVPFKEELFRVMSHGMLHLCGYNDKTKPERANMRDKENYYLKKLRLSA